MTTELMDGLTVSLIVTIASMVLFPLLYWALGYQVVKADS